ncbi:eukaryotic translation initiation factor 3 subunit A-like protein [Euroglyphus maynei]|uniref:Eukaryotic translation initiation factor 3 subunit A n=1 Tax=Euroglyphus maynei TaxID=6958 RepID=A0A1Y3BC63_EURMA|nr:eukaryotic translation initiation factor 3 subunit A-like protein [Euroglyphus maynei]
MPAHFIHLENALKRANEFIEVQNKHRALEILCDVLHSKKHRVWQKKHEEIMMKYLELCVELKQSYVAKEGLFQYKIICQQTYISSFEDVIRKYIQMAEKKTNEAKEQSQANISEIDDLENAQTPEDILMSAVSVEGSQDRKDRVVLIPWVKFLWESYRQCLDMLKNNSKTERLYHDIAHQAFVFCIRYNRKTEFRKLCDNLHMHLDQLKRQQLQSPQQQNAINLNSPDSQAMQLETRLRQLDNAIQLELWQEAYKAADDIRKFNLMNLTKKGLGKPQLIASYYQKLSLVFWKANSNLFHATALFRLFHLSKELRKNITADDIQKMASRLVLATLSIPIPPIRPEIDKLVDTEENVIEQHHRNLSSLLGISSKPPTRFSLVKDLKRMGVLQFASQPIQDLFQLLEIEFNPLGICGRVQQIIDYIERSTADPEKATEYVELKQYIWALKEVTVIRLIREVAQVYRSIEFKRLAELCQFVDPIYLEKLVVESARRHDLQVRIDHRRGCYVFGTELRVSTGEEYIEGPYLQSMPNEQMRRQLVSMYSSLQKAIHLIEPDTIKQQREDLKRQIMKQYNVRAIEEHHMILSRQNLIEQRREMMEQMGIRRENEERKRMEEEEAKLREAEMQRLLEETKERERLKREKDEKEIRKQITMDQLKKMKEVLPDLELDNLDDDELAKLRPQDLHQKRVEQLEKERREQLAKQRKLERKVDHFERAKRLEEIPLLKQQYEEWRVQDQELWAKTQELKIIAMKEERELALKERERFARVLKDKADFEKRVLEGRHEEYEEKLRNFDRIVEEERKKRLEARRQKRIEERRVAYMKEKQEKYLAKVAEIQKRRMAEIEEKLRQDLAQPAGGKSENTENRMPPLSRPIVAAAAKQSEDSAEASQNWRSNRAIERKEQPAPAFPSKAPPPNAAAIGDRNREREPMANRGPNRPFQHRQQAPQSEADSAGTWRSSEKKVMQPPPPLRESRPPYGGRYSEGRQRPESRDGQEPRSQGPPPQYRPYSGRDSDSSLRRERGDRRETRGGFSRPMQRQQQSSNQGGNNWRQKPQMDSEHSGAGADDDGEGGWMKVDHGRGKSGNDRRMPDNRNRYGGRDSREDGRRGDHGDERMPSRAPPPLPQRRQ